MLETILYGAGAAVLLAPLKYALGLACKKIHKAKMRKLPKPNYDVIRDLENDLGLDPSVDLNKATKRSPSGWVECGDGTGKYRVVVNVYPGTWARFTAKVERNYGD